MKTLLSVLLGLILVGCSQGDPVLRQQLTAILTGLRVDAAGLRAAERMLGQLQQVNRPRLSREQGDQFDQVIRAVHDAAVLAEEHGEPWRLVRKMKEAREGLTGLAATF
jgi:hypothetical protein